MKLIKSKTVGRTALAAGLGAGMALTILAAPAQAATPDRGLFGAQDPTYDGVYRQGLAITGLVADGRKVPKRAITWLKAQQCDNGGFTAYRADTSKPCPKSNPTTFSGPDTNSTALAAMALRAVGEKSAAKEARGWIRRRQNADGGYPYYRGAASDANSTGLVMAALDPYRKHSSKAKKRRTRAIVFLRSTQLRCEAPKSQRGMLSFQPNPRTANSLASAQGLTGIVGTLPPVSRQIKGKSAYLKCDGSGRKPSEKVSVVNALTKRLTKVLKKNNGLPSSFGSGLDLTATAHAATGLATAGRSPVAVTRAVDSLRSEAATYTVKDGSAAPGSLGLLLNLTNTVDINSANFGGVNLRTELLGSLR